MFIKQWAWFLLIFNNLIVYKTTSLVVNFFLLIFNNLIVNKTMILDAEFLLIFKNLFTKQLALLSIFVFTTLLIARRLLLVDCWLFYWILKTYRNLIAKKILNTWLSTLLQNCFAINSANHWLESILYWEFGVFNIWDEVVGALGVWIVHLVFVLVLVCGIEINIGIWH